MRWMPRQFRSRWGRKSWSGSSVFGPRPGTVPPMLAPTAHTKARTNRAGYFHEPSTLTGAELCGRSEGVPRSAGEHQLREHHPMPWTSLAERINDLPLILAGPILRRTEPCSVSVWVALKEPRLVTLRVLASGRDGRLVRCLTGTRATIRLGDHLHIAVATATCAPRDNSLTSGRLYYYNLYFASAAEADGHVAEDDENLTSAGILQTGVAASAATNGLGHLTYPDHPLPSFALPPQDLRQLRIFHGSCRKPHGDGQDALAALDLAIAESSKDPDRRPHQLFLTGDQIYADDVALPLLLALTDASDLLFSGNQEELLPLVNLPAR